jgi:hypothetical protein
MKDFKINNEYKINSGFKIPENYFESFSEKVQLQINKEEPKVESIFYKKRTWISTIAAVLVIALSVTIFTKIAISPKEDTIVLENYITSQSDINQYDFVNLLDKNDIEEIKINLNLEDKNLEEVLTNSTDIESYLTE